MAGDSRNLTPTSSTTTTTTTTTTTAPPCAFSGLCPEEDSHSSLPSFHRNHLKYTKCYCEENTWLLCKNVRDHGSFSLDQFYAVFISNDRRLIPLWQQNSSTREDTRVVWDYHVILIQKKDDQRKESLVYDLDTLLSFPCTFTEYLIEAFKVEDGSLFDSGFNRMFRVIPASVYLEKFASDRSHMLKQDGSWLSPPPDHPPIRIIGCNNNIQSFINMTPGTGYGDVMPLPQLSAFFI